MGRIAIASLLVLVAIILAPLPSHDHSPPIGFRKIDITLFDIENLQKQVELFRARTGAPPSSEVGLQALLTTHPALLEKVPLDAWGNAYVYKQISSESRFSIYSVGVNGTDENGAGDDITGPSKSYSCSEYGVDCPLTSEDIPRLALAACAVGALAGLLISSGVLLYRSVRPNPSVKGTSRKRAAPYVER